MGVVAHHDTCQAPHIPIYIYVNLTTSNHQTFLAVGSSWGVPLQRQPQVIWKVIRLLRMTAFRYSVERCHIGYDTTETSPSSSRGWSWLKSKHHSLQWRSPIIVRVLPRFEDFWSTLLKKLTVVNSRGKVSTIHNGRCALTIDHDASLRVKVVKKRQF